MMTIAVIKTDHYQRFSGNRRIRYDMVIDDGNGRVLIPITEDKYHSMIRLFGMELMKEDSGFGYTMEGYSMNVTKDSRNGS